MSRSLLAVVAACLAGAAAVPATSTAAKGKGAKSHVVKTPKGKQLAVPVSVRYRLDGQGRSLGDSVVSTRVTGAAKLESGRVLRGVENRSVEGRARLRVEHHIFFSVGQTRVLRRALAAKQKVKLAVTSAARADLDGNGSTDARSTQRSTLTLGRPSTPKPAAAVGHQQGSNPCGVLGLPSTTCTNVTAAPWSATHLWDSHSFTIPCPSAFPYSADSVSTQTTSKRYTQSAWPAGSSTVVWITDDNVRGHPISYTPTAACSTSDLNPDRSSP